MSGQSRRSEIERGESGEWKLTEKGQEDLYEKALEEDLAREKVPAVPKKEGAPAEIKEFIPGPAAGREEKTEEKIESKEKNPEELKNAYFEWRDLERKAKKSFADQHESSWNAALDAKEKYHQLLSELVSEKGKPFYLPEEMAPEGGPQKFNKERLEKMVETELGLEKEYEKKVASESEKNEGIFKKLWRGYAKTSRATKLVLSSAVATGAVATLAVFGGSFVGLGLLGVYGAQRLVRSAFGASITAAVYGGFEKFLQPFIDKKAASIIEKTKQEQIKNLNDIRISEMQAELLRAKENLIKEHHRMAKQKRWLNIEKAVAAGLVGGTATLISGPLYESLFEKSSGLGAGPSGSEVAVPPIAGKAAEGLAQYSETIGRGGNLWNATRGIAERMGISNPDFNDAWRDSYVYIPEKGGVFHISEVDLVHPGAKVTFDHDSKVFIIEGERMGTSRDLYDALIKEGKPVPSRLEEMFGQKPLAPAAAEMQTEMMPERPFGDLHVEERADYGPNAPTFKELEEGYVGQDAEKFVSERLAADNISRDYYDKIKNSKVKDLLKIRRGTFWDIFRHLNDETAGRADIFAEWKLASLVKDELRNLLPLVQDKTIDEAIKFAAQNRALIK